MSVYNFFKNLFGIPNRDQPTDFGSPNGPSYDNERAWNEENQNNYRDHMRNRPDEYSNFSVFSDPLEMQRYFEQQMDEVMRTFEGFFGNRSDENSPFGFGGFGNMGDWFTPQIEEVPEHHQLDLEPPKSDNLRDHYLKPGYKHPTDKDTDTDLDGKLDLGRLDSILGSQPRQELIPRQSTPQTRSSFYGKSISSRTVHRPDGSVEIHRTTKDHEGNEETVITRQIGDKQYTITTRKDKEGKEEKIEDIVNMDEKDVSQFLNIWQEPRDRHENDPNRYFPFDKFFK